MSALSGCTCAQILQRFEPDVLVQHANGYGYRRIGMRGSDGKVHHFLVQYVVYYITAADERMAQ